MTREAAIRRARKLWGAKAKVRATAELSSPERREAAGAKAREIKARREAMRADVDARVAQFKRDTGLDLIEVECKRLGKEQQEAFYYATYYKFAIGLGLGFVFSVQAQGDTWEDAFRKVEGGR